ncbi:MAG TPA: outer membrane protein transport protein [Gemmatimonadaceae bacterium]|nr:outer membrane protein transport protein [Gemmatimonadaceae bacterium]
MTLHRASGCALALALLAVPAVSGAQAFGLNEIGSCAIARGYAATAEPCDDASSIYWNPGALPRTTGFSFYGGAAMIKIDGSFTQDTTFNKYEGDVPTQYVPHVFLNYRGAGRLAYGIGAYVPFGLTSQWGDEFPGRFAAKKASLKTLYVQPNVAFQLNDNWSVGGGPIYGHSSVELVQAVDLASVPTPAGPTFGQLGIPARTEFARARVKGSANGYGFALGVQGKLNPEWKVGVRFLSQVTFRYDDADATFEPRETGLILAANNPFGVPAGTPVDALLTSQFATGGALSPQKASTVIRHPAQIEAGFAYTGWERTTLSFDYAYVGWQSFETLPITFSGGAPSRTLVENYGNTSSLRVGLEHRTTSGFALRGGFAAGTAAAPPETVTPLLPEMDRGYGMLGAGIPLMGRYAIDAAYAHVFTGGRRGRIDERPAGSSSTQALALNSGWYSLSADVFSLSLKASF